MIVAPGNTFNNFFSRIDRPGIFSGERGTRTQRNGYRPLWAGPSEYSYNWTNTRNAPGTYKPELGVPTGRSMEIRFPKVG